MRYVLLALAPFLLLLACDSGAPPNEAADAEDTADGPAFQEEGTLTLFRDGMEPLEIAIEIADTEEARARANGP